MMTLCRNFKRGQFLWMVPEEPLPIARLNKRAEERVWLEWLGFEFGVKLASQEEWMSGDFYYFDVGGVGGGSGNS